MSQGAQAKRSTSQSAKRMFGSETRWALQYSARDFFGVINMMQTPSTLTSASDIEQEILQLVATNKDLENCLSQIADVLHRHEPRILVIVVLANKSENIFAYADSAHSNGPVAGNFREFAEDSSGTPGRRALCWDFQFGSFTDIGRYDVWADPW